MNWITNTDNRQADEWRSRGYVVGEPEPSKVLTVEQMKEAGLVGVYRTEHSQAPPPLDELQAAPFIKSLDPLPPLDFSRFYDPDRKFDKRFKLPQEPGDER